MGPSFRNARIGFLSLAFLATVACSRSTAALPDPADGAWQQLAPPPWLIWHSAVYDPVRDRMILFGGVDGLRRQAELWELSFTADPVWRPLRPRGTGPPPVTLHGAVYDPLGDRMLVLGGSIAAGVATTYSNQVWALSLNGDPAWTLVTVEGTPPVPRTCRQLVYDSIARRVLLFGGTTAAGLTNDVWSLSLAGTPAWSPVATVGTPPSVRSSASLVFDPVRNRVLLFGGMAMVTYFDETWELALAGNPEWRQLSPGGAAPAARSGHTAYYDPSGDRMIVLNGTALVEGDPVGLRETWSLSLGADPAWSPLAAAGPAHPGGSGGSVVCDSQRQRALFFGGWIGNTSSVSQAVWTLSMDAHPTWSILTDPEGPKATGRRGHSAVYDPLRHRMIVFGGWVNWLGEPSPYVNDVWSLDLDPPYAWRQIQTAGTPPAGRYGHSAVYDPVRDRMIVFGGQGPARTSDLWELTLSSNPVWHPLTATGVPPAARTHHSAVYDPVGDRMLLFGGFVGAYTADVWELSLGAAPAWRLLPVAGPGPRSGHTAIYDPLAARMIVFGGYNGSDLADLWQLQLAGAPQWAPLAAAGTPPAGREYHAAVYDSRHHRMLILGGLNSRDDFLGDLTGLSLAEPPQWRTLAPENAPLPQYGMSAIYDPTQDGMWVYGGAGAGSNVVRAYWPAGGPTTPVWVEDFALEPAGSGIAIRWRTARPARAEDFDLTGSDGATRWTVRIAPVADNSFVAEDRSAPSSEGGDVRYTLAWNEPDRGWVIVAEQTWSRGANPARALLLAPRPNPTRGPVQIPFVLGRTEPVQVTVEDAAGRVVRRLHAGPMPRGTGRLAWDGVGTSGRRVASGVYFVRLATATGTQTRKLVLTR